MSVLVEWKKFNLFNLVPCTEYTKLRNVKSDVTATCYNESYKVFCDRLGKVHVFYNCSEPVSFQAHSSGIKLCALTKDSRLLITLEQDEARSIFLQVFNIQKLSKRRGAPCISSAQLTALSSALVIQTCTINVHLCIAIGLKKGDILLHRSQIYRDSSLHFHRLTISSGEITGIQFRQRDNSSYNMFVCSAAGVFCYTLTDNNVVSESKVVLESKNAVSSCCALYTGALGESYFIVGRDDAVYCFTEDGRGPCYAIEGRKKCIGWYDNNLVVVIEMQKTALISEAPSLLVIIDIQNKLIVLSKEISRIVCAMVEKTTYVLTKDNEVFVVCERDIQSKIRLLISKNLYDIALRLLEGSGCNENNAAHINFQYGNYLLMKGDLSGAVNKYVKTVGVVEPYYIISKLLDSRYNEFLAQYLKALVQTGFATMEHMELLLHCNSRLDLTSEIYKMCSGEYPEYDLTSNEEETSISKNKAVAFSSLNIITFKSMVGDVPKMRAYFMTFKEEAIYNFLMENSEVLMSGFPQEITDILKFACCCSPDKEPAIQYPERFIPLLMSHSNYCMEYLEHLIHNNTNRNKVVYNFLFMMHLRAWHNIDEQTEKMINFLKQYSKFICAEHILILCKNYSFWPGAIHIYENSMQYCLRLKYFVNSSHYQNALTCTGNKDYISPHLWIQAFSKEKLVSDSSITLMNYLLDSMLNGRNYSLLQVLHSISSNKTVMVMHIKDFLTQEHWMNVTKQSAVQSETVKQFNNERNILKDLLSKFFMNPLEFRSSVCDICRQQLNVPAVYFLCQHSFHKDCLRAYSDKDVCVACIGNRNHTLEAKSEYNCETTPCDFAAHKDVIDTIAMLLSRCLFERFAKETQLLLDNVDVDNTNKDKVAAIFANESNLGAADTVKKWPGRFFSDENSTRKERHTPKKFGTEKNTSHSNPFEEYDDNLNPFAD